MLAKPPSARSLAVDFLKENPRQKYSASKIVDELLIRHPDYVEQRQESLKGKNIKWVLAAEIGSSKPNLHADGIRWTATTDHQPTLYSFEGTDAPICYPPDKLLKRDPALKSVPKPADSKPRGRNYLVKIKESDLYRPLEKWLGALSPTVHAYRIDEKSTSSRYPKANHWRFPDLVGYEPLSDNWSRETLDFADDMGAPNASKVRLWSFEVKEPIIRSTVREFYFQAVSNSSWAHVGYLVARECDKDAEEEIRILNEVHGIGLITLAGKDLSQGQIRINARPRRDLDWNAINKLCKSSREFRGFAKRVSLFVSKNIKGLPT